MYDIAKIHQASDVADAIRALTEDPKAVVISGGSDVLIKIRDGELAGCSLVSIHGISALEGVYRETDGTIIIRPATTFTHVTAHPVIAQYMPMLGEAVDQVGGPQVRSIGTIGGNVCNGVTSADSASTLFTYNAVIELTGPGGVRMVPIAQFYTGPGRTVREHNELMTGIHIQKEDYEGFYGHYIKYAQRNAMDIATLGCAVNVKLNTAKDAVEEMRLAFGVAAPTPVRCPKAEAAAVGRKFDAALFAEIGALAITEISPRTSWRASREYRLQLANELSQRALRKAIERAGVVINA